MSGAVGLMGEVEATEAQIIQRRRSRITTLQGEIDRCDTRVDVVRSMQAKYREELAGLLEEEACRPNKSAPVAVPDGSDVPVPEQGGFEVFPRPRPQSKLIPDAQARDAARRLGMFTDAELAAVAGVTVREAKKAIASFLERGIVTACNCRFKAREMYEYEPGRDREKARQGRRIKTKHGKA